MHFYRHNVARAIKEGIKSQLYLIKELHGKVQCVNLKNEQVTGYVETAKSMCFDENNKLYLYCEKDDVIGKTALTFVSISWEGGIRAEIISRKIVETGKKQTTFKQMERDTHNYSDTPHPLNLDFDFNGIQEDHK